MSVFAEIRDDERRSAIGAFLTLFGIIASHTILETARDALFLARLPAAQLPWVYLVMAAAAVALGQIPARRLQGMFGPSGLSASLGLMSGLTALFWALPDLGHSDWGLRALYVWNGLVATISVLQFWLVLGEIFTITEAKRVYRFVGIGSLLGAVAGAVIARVVSAQLGAPRLIPAAALLMALTALGPALLLRRAQPGAGGPPLALRWTLAEARDLIATQPYVTRLAGLVLVSTVAVTLGDFVFKSTVARHVPAEELGQFFATFYMALNFLALLAQLVLMGWLLRTVGLHRALWTLPILLFLGASGVAVGGGLAAALLLKGADGALRYSVHRTGTELLFLPIPDALRARVKPVIDVFGQRGGQAIASLLILSELGLGRGDLSLAAIAALLCVVWIAAAAEMIPHYVQMFRQALREGMITDRGGLPELDLNSLEALFAGLNSDDDVEVIASLDLLLAEGRGGLIPALILYHPSRRVVLRARTMARPEQAVLRRALDDESPLVRATAAVNLVASGWASEGAQTLIAPLLASGLPVGRRALARAIERRPAPEFDKTLLQLSLSSEVDVQVSVANALGALKDERALGTLLAMLARHEVRAAAGSAIVRYGAVGLQFLDEALADTSYPQELRRQIPRTIRRLPAKDAARVLLKHMLGEQDGMVRFKILRALNRLAADNPSVALDRGVLKEAVRRTLGVVFSLAHWRHLLASGADERRATAGHELLASLVRDKQAHATERLFRLLGLLYRSENFESIHRGVLSSSPRLRASSRELLEAVLRSPLREALLAVVDGAPWPQSAPVAAPYYRAAATGYEELLTSLLGSPSESLRCLAAHHIAELGLRSLRPAIEAQRARESALFVEQVLAKALRTLEPALGYAR